MVSVFPGRLPRGCAPCAFVLALSLASCGGGGSDKGANNQNPTNPSATTRSIAKLAGDAQSATVGAAVASAPSVKVSTSAGAAVSGVAITFAVASGGGGVSGATQTTDANGVATVGSWTLGQTAGANALTATAAGTVSGSPLTFTATGVPATASQLSKQPGDGQTGTAGQNVASPPAVLLRDQFGNAVANVAVTFAVASGGGSVTGGTATTGSNGIATVGSWKLGNAPGVNTLTATAAGSGIAGNPATFSATATAGPPATIAKVSGDNQTATPGTAVPLAPTVRVTDAVGNSVTGAGVTFAAASGGGTVTGGTQTTATDGTAKPTAWTLGATAGANTLTATAAASGVAGSPLTFTATGGGLNVATYAGTWSGTWTNATFASTGTTSIVIAAGASANQLMLSHSGTGTVLGGSGAPLETRTNVPYTASAFTLTTVSTTFGNVTLNVDASGNITGSGTSVPNAAIARWDCTGTITATQIRINFTVTFTGGGTATGTIAVNKQ